MPGHHIQPSTNNNQRAQHSTHKYHYIDTDTNTSNSGYMNMILLQALAKANAMMKKRVIAIAMGSKKSLSNAGPTGRWRAAPIATTTMQVGDTQWPAGCCTPVARRVLEEERKEDSRKRESFKYFPAGRLLGIQRHC
jgi:hypothetical protein